MDTFWCSCAQFTPVQSLSHAQASAPLWTAARQASLAIANSCRSLKLRSAESVMPSHPLSILCPSLTISSSVVPFSSCLQSSAASRSFPVSQLFASVAKVWSFSFSTSPSNEHPGLTSFRVNWLDLLAVQGTCNSLLQHHSSKASILRCSVFFTVQHSHLYDY